MNKKLYNIIFQTCLIENILPFCFLFGVFAIDSLVILIISKMIFGKVDKNFYKKVILKVWSLGCLIDIFAAIFLMFLLIMQECYYPNYKYVTGYVVPAALSIIMASVLIFVFNYFITFKNIEITKKQKVLSTIIIAILTTPYILLISVLY